MLDVCTLLKIDFLCKTRYIFCLKNLLSGGEYRQMMSGGSLTENLLGGKGQCHEIVDTFFDKKTSPGLHTNSQFFFSKTFSKNVCPTPTRCQRGHWLRWHRVCIVIDYVDTVSALSTTMHYADDGQDYADTFRKLWRLLTDFKVAIRWKRVQGCVYKPNNTDLKM